MATTDGKWAIVCGKCRERYTWTGPLSPTPPCPKCSAPKATATKSKQADQEDEEVENALAIAEEIEELAGQLPPEGEDFGESVAAKASDIADNIRRHGRVTDAQLSALENMLAGLNRWFSE